MRLSSDLVHPRLLQLLNLSLEALYLLPAIQRSAIVFSQAADDLTARRFHVLGQVADRLALLELLPQSVDLLSDGVCGAAFVVLELVGGGGKGLVRLCEGVGFSFGELLELFRHAGLDLLLNELGARSISLSIPRFS